LIVNNSTICGALIPHVSRDRSKLDDDDARGNILRVDGKYFYVLISFIFETVPNLDIVIWSQFVCCGTLDMFLLILVFSDRYPPFLLWNIREE